MTDRILLEGLVFYGYHGVRPPEGELGQRFGVDVELVTDLRPAALADDIALTVNYSHLYRVVERVVTGTPAKLLESVAERIAAAVLADCPGGEVRVRVRKLAPPIKGATVGTAGVEVVRRGILPPAVPD